jgi:hypothetical protein
MAANVGITEKCEGNQLSVMSRKWISTIKGKEDHQQHSNKDSLPKTFLKMPK